MGSSRTRSHQLDNTLLKLMGHDDKKEKLHTDLCHFKVNRAVYTPRGALRCAPPLISHSRSMLRAEKLHYMTSSMTGILARKKATFAQSVKTLANQLCPSSHRPSRAQLGEGRAELPSI